MSRKTYLPFIPLLKFLLIALVILIHCNANVWLEPTPARALGLNLERFMSQGVCSLAVPGFFILSGYLFFLNVERFNMRIYGKKLRSRVHTLLLPYLFWNTFCLLLFTLKVTLLNFEGAGIIISTGVDIPKLLEGYVAMPGNNGMPYAFAFWFIRNLMVYVILAPIAFLIGKRWVGIVILFIMEVCGCSTYGFIWFCTGAALALHSLPINRLYIGNLALILPVISLLAASYLYTFLTTTSGASFLLLAVIVSSGMTLTVNLAIRLRHIEYKSPMLQQLVAATFFIYAFHQCFCTLNGRLWLSLAGDRTSCQVIAAYILCFLTLLFLSFGVYKLLTCIAPKFLAFVTGNRT